MQQQENSDNALENRPGILMVGSSNVGKRTLISRLLSVDFEDGPEDDPSSSSNVTVHGWAINTKYYTADVTLWMAHLQDGFDIGSTRIMDRLEALVMVFDVNNLSSLTALQEWVSSNDIQNFEIILCIGNKVDLLPGHPVHAEYRRRLQKLGADSDDLFIELTECGISETEGSSLLGDEKPSWEIRNSCLEWCNMHNIEYVEACASNADFDKCLSVNGDLQGTERLFGALTAHMWPGMILKSGDKITEPSLPENEASSEEDTDYEFEYEVLSAGSADLWGDTDEGWVSAAGPSTSSDVGKSGAESSSASDHQKDEQSVKMENISDREVNRDATSAAEPDETESEKLGESFKFEDLEQMMSEIGNIRDSLRLMPDFQRREMAANLAMKMAGMFGGGGGDGSSDEGE